MQAAANAVVDSNRAQLNRDRGPLAKDLLLELFRHLGVTAEVTLVPGEDIALHARLGENAEPLGLGGPRPPMHEPLVYLLSKMVNRGLPEGGPRAFVRLSFGEEVPAQAPAVDETDPDLLVLGKVLAERARTLNKTLTVGPMTARERRSLHVAAKEVGGVTTRSEGDGLLRRVLIIPPSNGSGQPVPDAAP